MTATPLIFGMPDLAARLDQCSAEELDTLDFGVIGFGADTNVERYNAFESQAAGLSPQRVLGQPLFTNVAPCMNNFMVAQRFLDARTLDEIIPYVLTLRMRPTPVRLRLLMSPEIATRYLLIERKVAA